MAMKQSVALVGGKIPFDTNISIRKRKREDMINFDNIGLVDLHLHLDGSLSVDSVKELMQIQGIKNCYSDSELLEKLQVSDGSVSYTHLIYTYLFTDKICISKIVCGIIFSICITVITFAVKLFCLLSVFGVGILEKPIQSVLGYNYTYFNVKIWQYLIMYIICTSIGSMLLFLIDFIIIALVLSLIHIS